MLRTLYTYSSKPTTVPNLFKSDGITNNVVPVCIALCKWACLMKADVMFVYFRCSTRLYLQLIQCAIKKFRDLVSENYNLLLMAKNIQ